MDKDRIQTLNLWEGDKVMFRLMEERGDPFSSSSGIGGTSCWKRT